MNSKVIGVIAGIALALVLFRNDLMFWNQGKVEGLYKEAEALYKDARKSEDYSESKYLSAIAKYDVAFSKASNADRELLDEFNVLVNYKKALCYLEMAEREGPDGVANYDKALDTIEMISPKAKVPGHQEGITYLWGYVLYKREKYAEAEPKLRELIKNFPNSQFKKDVLYALGNVHYNLKNYPEARAKLQSLLDQFPNSGYTADARFLIAQSHLKENNLSEANKCFAELDPEKLKTSADEAKYREIHNRFCLQEECLQEYKDFVAKYPDSELLAAAHFDMGNIYLEKKEYEDARRYFDLALQTLQNATENPNIYEDMALRANLGVADINFIQEKWEKAIEYYEHVYDDDASNEKFKSYSALQIAEAYSQLGNFNKSDEWAQKVSGVGADSALEREIWNAARRGDNSFAEAQTIANYDGRKNKYVQAAEHYNTVWTKAEGQSNFFALRLRAKYRAGLCYFEAAKLTSDNGKFDPQLLEQSAQAYRNAIYDFDEDFNPSEQEDFRGRLQYINDCRFNLAQTYEKQKQWGNARAQYGEIITYETNLQPEEYTYYNDAKLLMARSYVAEGSTNEAIDAYQDLIDDAKGSWNAKNIARINKAKLQRDAGKHTQAAQLYEAFFNESITRIDQAKQLYEAEKYDEAANSYLEIANLYENSVAANDPNTAHLNEDKSLCEQGKYKQAADLYSKIAEHNVYQTQYLAGVSYHRAQDSRVEQAFQQVIAKYQDKNEHPPYLVEAYYGKALVYKDGSKWKQLIELADDASDRFSQPTEDENSVLDDIKNLRRYALHMDFADGSFPRFRADLYKNIAEEISKDTGRLNEAETLYDARNYNEAFKLYKDIVDEEDDTSTKARAQSKLGHIYYNSEESGSPVITTYGDISDDRSARYQIAAYKYSLNDYEGCIEATNNILMRHRPTNDKNMLARLYYMLGSSTLKSKASLAELSEEEKTVAKDNLEQVIKMSNVRDVNRKAIVDDSYRLLIEYNLIEPELAIDRLRAEIQNNPDDTELDRSKKIDNYHQIAVLYSQLMDNSTDDSKKGEYANGVIDTWDGMLKYYTEHYMAPKRDAEIKKNIDKIVEVGIKYVDVISATADTVEDLNVAIAKAQNLKTEIGTDYYECRGLSQRIYEQYIFGSLYRDRMFQKRKENQGNWKEDGEIAISAFIQVENAVNQLCKDGETIPADAKPIIQDAVLLKGIVAREILDWNNAEAFLTHYIETYGSNSEVSFTLSEVKHNLRQYDKAAEILNSLIKDYSNAPDIPLWNYNLGLAYYAQEQYPEALSQYESAYTKAEEMQNNQIAEDALHGQFSCLYKLKDARYVTIAQNFVKKFSTSRYAPELYFSLGLYFREQGMQVDEKENIDQKREHYETALAYYLAAYNHPKAGKYKGMVKTRLQQLRRSPAKYLITLYKNKAKNAGYNHASAMEMYKKAIELYKQLLNLLPSEAELFPEGVDKEFHLILYIPQIYDEVARIKKANVVDVSQTEPIIDEAINKLRDINIKGSVESLIQDYIPKSRRDKDYFVKCSRAILLCRFLIISSPADSNLQERITKYIKDIEKIKPEAGSATQREINSIKQQIAEFSTSTQ